MTEVGSRQPQSSWPSQGNANLSFTYRQKGDLAARVCQNAVPPNSKMNPTLIVPVKMLNCFAVYVSELCFLSLLPSCSSIFSFFLSFFNSAPFKAFKCWILYTLANQDLVSFASHRLINENDSFVEKLFLKQRLFSILLDLLEGSSPIWECVS